MTGNLKVLGLGFIAVLALGAVSASAAQAKEGEFIYQAGATKLTVVADATGGTQAFTFTVGVVECNEMTGEATTFGAHKVTINHISYRHNGSVKCPGPLGTEPEIQMQGCHYSFHTGNTINNMEVEGTVIIEHCEEAGGFKGIVMSAPGCAIRVPEQTIGPVFYKTITGTPHDVTIEWTVVNLEYTHEGFICGSGGANAGTYTGNLTLRGFNAAAEQTGVEVE